MDRSGAGRAARALCVGGSLLALGALIGCGSSAPSRAGTSAAQTQGASTASTTSTAGSLRVTGKPKYATPSSSEPVQAGVVQIAYRLVAIHPDTLRVKAGSTVRWTNYDAVEHNVTSESGPQSFSSGNFAEGASFQVKLTRPGTLHYRCTIHPASMNGAIQVVP